MLTKFKTLFYLCLVTGILTLVFSCNNTPKTTEDVRVVKTPVTIVPVTFKKVTSTIDLPAVSTFMNKSIIRATTTGTIERISVVQGDYVIANQLLFTIRTREAKALQNISANDSSLSFKGQINISSPKEGVISNV
ncbi:MAG: efflux RND transporter periplasmic adaptor subunit, partial [Bacteroidetes bacterium]